MRKKGLVEEGKKRKDTSSGQMDRTYEESKNNKRDKYTVVQNSQ